MGRFTRSIIIALMFFGIAGRIVAGSQVIPSHTPFSGILLKYAPSESHDSFNEQSSVPLEDVQLAHAAPRPWYGLPDLVPFPRASERVMNREADFESVFSPPDLKKLARPPCA